MIQHMFVCGQDLYKTALAHKLIGWDPWDLHDLDHVSKKDLQDLHDLAHVCPGGMLKMYSSTVVISLAFTMYNTAQSHTLARWDLQDTWCQYALSRSFRQKASIIQHMFVRVGPRHFTQVFRVGPAGSTVNMLNTISLGHTWQGYKIS